MDDQANPIDRSIENRLRRAYKKLEMVQKVWISSFGDPSIIDDILNQLDQRASVANTSFTDTNLGRIPHFRERLLSKIDIHITQLCQDRISPILDALDDQVNTLKSIYELAGNACHDPDNGLPLLTVAELKSRTEIRPEFSDLFSWLDECVVWMKLDLGTKRSHFDDFKSGQDVDAMRRLRRAWKVPFKIQQRWATLRFMISAFMDAD